MPGLPVQNLIQCSTVKKRHHRLANAGAIGWADLPGLREHLDRVSGVAFVDVQHLTHDRAAPRCTVSPNRAAQRIQMRAGDWGQAALLPRGMGQTDQSKTWRVGPTLGIEMQHPLIRQRLNQAIERSLGNRRASRSSENRTGSAECSDLIQNVQRLTYRPVTARLLPIVHSLPGCNCPHVPPSPVDRPMPRYGLVSISKTKFQICEPHVGNTRMQQGGNSCVPYTQGNSCLACVRRSLRHSAPMPLTPLRLSGDLRITSDMSNPAPRAVMEGWSPVRRDAPRPDSRADHC